LIDYGAAFLRTRAINFILEQMQDIIDARFAGCR
jgi:hypothetical protein